jgi:hypothetical protein
MGQCRLADVQRIQQFAGTHFSVVKELQNPNPVFITQSLENKHHVLFVKFHQATSY